MKTTIKKLGAAVASLFAASSLFSGDGGQGRIAKVGPEEFRQLIESEGAEGTLLDARTPQEVREGHIEGAINLNFYDSDFREQLESLDESKPVYVYCRSGGRSGRAAKMLRAAGFPKVYDLEGGILAWKEADMPLVEESEKPER